MAEYGSYSEFLKREGEGMKVLSFIAFVFLGFSTWAQQVPVVGSCTQSSLRPDWSQCDFTAVADPRSKVHGDVPSCMLSCYHMANYQSNENCQYPPKVAECNLVNPSYAGVCIEHVEYFGSTTAEQACGEIRDFLNQLPSISKDGCLKTYCRATHIRLPWSLKSAN